MNTLKCRDKGINGWQREYFIFRFLTVVVHGVFIDANDRKGDKMTNN